MCKADVSTRRISPPVAITTMSRAVDVARPNEPATLSPVLKLEPILSRDSPTVKASNRSQSSIPAPSVPLRPLRGKENVSSLILRPKPKFRVATSGTLAPTSVVGATPAKSLLRVKNRQKEGATTPLRARAVKPANQLEASQDSAVHETKWRKPRSLWSFGCIYQQPT